MGSNTVVQYVIVSGDLIKKHNWPVGAVITQACHAVTAVTHLFYSDDTVQKYLSDLDNMHKIVLEAPNEENLRQLHEQLKENDIQHKLWIEQPENFATCLAVKPYSKNQVQKYFKKFKLLKI